MKKAKQNKNIFYRTLIWHYIINKKQLQQYIKAKDI